MSYLIWRVTSTLDWHELWAAELSLGFFFLEAVANISSIAVMVILVRLRPRSEEADNYRTWVREFRPRVSIFIATYNEEESILDRTILGALNQDYPVTIYLLDDGRRPEIARLCAKRGITYLTRPDNRHAKAGNMNAGLALSCPRLSGPSTMIVWTTKGTTNAEQEAQAGRDHREAT